MSSTADTPPFEFLWIVKESAYGTPMNTPVAGTDSIYIRLADANRFTMRMKPNQRQVPFGGGYAVPGYSVSDKFTTEGNLQVELCYSQAKLLLDWAVTRVTSAQTTPWTTTEPGGDLSSCSVYHAVMRDDGTIRRRLYSGTKVSSWSLASSSESGLTTLNLGLQAQRAAGTDPTSGAFAAPADTAFPTDPILFYHAGGQVTVAASALTYLVGLNASAENTLDAPYFSSLYPTFSRLRGRTSKLETDVLYTASPEWRTIYEALTTKAIVVAWTNTTHTVTLTYNSNNLISDVTDDLTPGKVYMQKLAWQNYYDTSSGDISFTYS